ncbi:MAG: hypothetical protein JRG76_08380 [Deltaproteobacteria bacterium]|nr:hypothetical protein [Deltaproteobacteria bacterium]MBW2414511.1 hypothetical protein [Deltaproteobacteria bacterium]
MAIRKDQNVDEIDEALDTFEINLKRLRIEYEQYFKGAIKREPYQLLGRVQKVVTGFASDPPRRVSQKFRFNSLVARFQSLRQLWGRTQRELERGVHSTQRFRNKHTSDGPAAPKVELDHGGGKKTGIDQLTDALIAARRKIGQDSKGVSKERIAAMVAQQRQAIAAKYGDDVKVAFRVVVEDGKAKVKANVKRVKSA